MKPSSSNATFLKVCRKLESANQLNYDMASNRIVMEKSKKFTEVLAGFKPLKKSK